MNLRTPDFVIIGAAKSGTTSLYEYLCNHPQIYMAVPKEPDFFSVDTNYARGIEWYSSLFGNAASSQICGEASTSYSRWHQHPQTVARIYHHLPQVKLIYIMRHPVDRAYSFYRYRFKNSLHTSKFNVLKSFEATIKQESEYIDSSYYLEQINQYLKYFPQESMLLLLMEDLIEAPAETLKKVLDFINVDSEINLLEKGEIVANKAGDYPDWFVKKQLLEPIKKVPGMNLVSSLFPKEIKSSLYKTIKKMKYNEWKSSQFVPPPMLPETRTMLLEKFKQPNAELSEFLQRDLSHWNK